jgi:hypothetical protein
MSQLAKIFEVDRKAINLPRAALATGVLLAVLVVLEVIGEQRYFLSVSFGVLFVALSDPGGPYRARLHTMGGVGVIGAFLTALAFAIGGGPWGWVVLAAFVVTFTCGLALKLGTHSFVAAALLNAWFLVAVSVPAGKHLTASHSAWGKQGLAWLAGAAVWIGVTLVGWLLQGRREQQSHFPEFPANTSERELTRPVVLFLLIRAFAVGVAVAIAFGLHLPNADWMPIATFIAMKSSLGQATLAAEQRIAGALIGAVVAAVFLLTVDSIHVLEFVMILAGGFAASFRAANYAIYCAGIAAAVLIGADLSHPSTSRQRASACSSP